MKNIKILQHTISFILSFCVFFYCVVVYASDSIELKIDKTEIDISELITIQIAIQFEDQENPVQINLPGLDNFHMIGRSQNQSTIVQNGEAKNNFVLSLTLKGKKAWDYTLWPVVFWDIQSNSVDLKITWVEIFTWGTAWFAWSQTPDPDSQEELDAQIEAEKEQEAQIEQSIMASPESKDPSPEFQDIMENQSVPLLSFRNSFLFFLVLASIFIALKLFRYYNSRETVKKQVLEEEVPLQPTNFSDLIDEVEKQYLNAEKEVFYAQLGDIIRQYLDEKYEAWLSTKTLWEIRSQMKNKPSLVRIYEKIYFPEYNTETDNTEQRLYIINNLKDECI